MKKNNDPGSVFAFSTKKTESILSPVVFLFFFNSIYSLKPSNAARRQQGRRSGVNPARAGVVKPLDWKPPNQTERAFY